MVVSIYLLLIYARLCPLQPEFHVIVTFSYEEDITVSPALQIIKFRFKKSI